MKRGDSKEVHFVWRTSLQFSSLSTQIAESSRKKHSEKKSSQGLEVRACVVLVCICVVDKEDREEEERKEQVLIVFRCFCI